MKKFCQNAANWKSIDFRYLVWEGENLIAQIGIEHRVITNTGIPARIFGSIDLCVALSYHHKNCHNVAIANRRIGENEQD